MAAGPVIRHGDKVMTAAEAVAQFVRPGAVLGMGGQNIGRCPMALTHEIIRQRIGGLTVAGCNLSISMDLLAGAGLVRRTLCGSGNLERFGTIFCWRRAVEAGTIEVEDYSHLAMVTRFLAGEMGVPFMPTRSLLGSDILRVTDVVKSADAAGPAGDHGQQHAGRPHPDRPVVIDNPWQPGEPVALVPALRPDVSIVHVQRADPMGNVVIEGFATHEPEMVRASRRVIVSCEELVSTDEIRDHPEQTTVPFIYVSAVVVQPFGAYPTSVYRYYDYDAAHIGAYQDAARAGAGAVRGYLEANVWECATFDHYLRRAADPDRLDALRRAMREAI
jgi:glutaconate CoA-transferase subunit A